jgi:hypothetical protein
MPEDGFHDRDALSQSDPQALLIGVGSAHEGIEQPFLEGLLLPDNRSLETHTLLGCGGPLISRCIEDGALTEVPHVLHEPDKRLSQMLLQRSPSNEFPGVQGQVADRGLEEDRL